MKDKRPWYERIPPENVALISETLARDRAKLQLVENRRCRALATLRLAIKGNPKAEEALRIVIEDNRINPGKPQRMYVSLGF
jgi:hypothetical protein